ncbi:MAG: sugar phosphate isomerase/epimerase family protein [Mycobacterium sp.]
MERTPQRHTAHLSMGAICFRDRPFPEILAAASASGFTGIGLTVGQCVSALERGIGLDEISARVTDAGLRVAELELIRLGDDGPARHANSLVEDLCHALVPDRVHVAAFVGEPPRILDQFSAVCGSLAPVPVAFEFMPYSRVPDLAQAVGLAERTGATNARVVLDVVHFFRSGGDPADLTAQRLDWVAGVQLSDVAVRPGVPLAYEARHLRTYPGRGTLDIGGFLRGIAKVLDVLPPVSIEPISDALELLPLPVVAEEIMYSTLGAIAAAGWVAGDGAFTRA